MQEIDDSIRYLLIAVNQKAFNDVSLMYDIDNLIDKHESFMKAKKYYLKYAIDILNRIYNSSGTISKNEILSKYIREIK